MAWIALTVLLGAGLLFGLIHLLGGERDSEGTTGPWFEDLAGIRAPADDEIVAVARWLGRRFLGATFEDPPTLADAELRIVFLTLGDGQGPGAVVFAVGDGLVNAAERALALASARQGERHWTALKVDVVASVDPVQEVEDRGRLRFERGLHGLAFRRASGLAFLPEEAVVRTLVNSDNEIRGSNVSKYLAAMEAADERNAVTLWPAGTEPVHTFTTLSYWATTAAPWPLYRGHRELGRMGPQDLLDAAVLAGGYLQRSVRPNGAFVYAYLAKTNREKDDYNMLRHAGTTYSMLELYEETGEEELLRQAELALDYLRRQIVECRAGGVWGACVEENGHVKLGGNALAILALAKHAEVTGDASSLPLMQRLARWMTAVQNESGEFSVHKLRLESGEIDDHVSEYYPGEALFALMRLHELDRKPQWLDAASRGADWLIGIRDGALDDAELSHDHWLLYALNELHRARGDALHERHALRLARVIAAAQNRDPAFPDWRGSYYKPPRSTPTATRSEGLCAAYFLAERVGRHAEAGEILEAARLGVDFQLQLQFRPESTLYLPDPARALGGFPRSLTDFEIRIDYVQHNLSSFLALRRILLRPPPAPHAG